MSRFASSSFDEILRRKSLALAIYNKRLRVLSKIITHPCLENSNFLPCKRICSSGTISLNQRLGVCVCVCVCYMRGVFFTS